MKSFALVILLVGILFLFTCNADDDDDDDNSNTSPDEYDCDDTIWFQKSCNIECNWTTYELDDCQNGGDYGLCILNCAQHSNDNCGSVDDPEFNHTCRCESYEFCREDCMQEWNWDPI